MLQQALALFDYYTTLIAECDRQIEQQFAAMRPRFAEAASPPLMVRKPNSKSKNKPNFNARAALKQAVGMATSAMEYNRQCRDRELKALARKAARLGYTLTPQAQSPVPAEP